MPETAANLFNSLSYKAQDAWYWLLFTLPFLIGATVVAGKPMMEPEHSFKWNISIIITIIVLAFGGFRSFISLEKDMQEVMRHSDENEEELDRREKYINAFARAEKDVVYLRGELQRIADETDERIDEEHSFHMRRLNAAVAEGAEDHTTMAKLWKAEISKNRSEVEKVISQLDWRQNILWDAKNQGGRFTAEKGKEHMAEIKTNRAKIAEHAANDIARDNALSGRLTRLFADIDALENKIDNYTPPKSFMWNNEIPVIKPFNGANNDAR